MPDELHLLGPIRHHYDDLVADKTINADPAQHKLIAVLDQLLSDIRAKRLSSKSSALGWLFGQKNTEPKSGQGLYIWGGVGRGKTWLMDIFYSKVDTLPKRRVHFHDFMQEVHQHIHNHRQIYKAGRTQEKDPIPPVAKKIAAKAKLLCFDEFSVSDITDAMLLGRLFKVLFDEGVIVVATSNIAPHDLYKDGLNRQLFVPFIELLQSKLMTHELISTTDYRLAKLPNSSLYNWPLNKRSEKAMDQAWGLLTDEAAPESHVLKLKGRELRVPRATKSVCRFHFDQLCREARGASDYLAISNNYQIVMIDNIPIILSSERNVAKRFIALIDILYDHHCKLIVSADAKPELLFQSKSGKEAFEFERTASRLIEMQSLEYDTAIQG